MAALTQPARPADADADAGDSTKKTLIRRQ
jgi:hypothetical protein